MKSRTLFSFLIPVLRAAKAIVSTPRYLRAGLIGLALLASAAEAAPVPRIWVGTITKVWSDPNNWSPVGIPVNGDLIYFPNYSPFPATINDIQGLTLSGLNINNIGYSITGNGFALTGPINSIGGTVINVPIDIRAPNLVIGGYSVSSSSYDNFAGGIDVNAPGLSIQYAQVGALDVHAYGVALTNVNLVGALSGTGAISTLGSYLSGTGTYSGTISGSDLSLNGCALPSATISNTSILIGKGTVGPMTVANLTPAAPNINLISHTNTPLAGTVGTISASSMTIGGSTTVPINSATAYSQLTVAGGVTISAGATLTLAVNPAFLMTQGQQYMLIKNNGTGPISGAFANLPEGGSIAGYGPARLVASYKGGDGNDLVLTVSYSPRVWSGFANNLWSQPANWANGLPQNGDDVIFPSVAGNPTNTNDMTGLVLNALTVNAPAYNLNGNGIVITGALNAVTGSVFNLPIEFRSTNFSGATFNGNIDLNGPALTLGPAKVTSAINVRTNDLIFSNGSIYTGSLSGIGFVDVDSAIFSGSSTFSGTILPSNLYLNGALLPAASVAQGNVYGNGSLAAVTAANIYPGQTFAFFPQGNATPFVASSVGTLRTGNLTIQQGASFQISGAAPGTGYSQIVVTGGVTINSAAVLSVAMNIFPLPVPGQQFVLISNDGTDAVNGNFFGMPEGSVVQINGLPFVITYRGGDGNDVSIVATGTAAATIGLTSSATPSVFGQQVTFTATFSGTAGTPTGAAIFYDGSTLLGSSPLVNGVAKFVIASLTQGSHAISVTYGGDGSYGTTSVGLYGGQTVNNSTIFSSPVGLADGIVNVTYAAVLTGSGGAGNYRFAVSSGTLPTGLTLSSSGTLSGKPTVTGSFAFIVTVTDGNNVSGSTAYTITIAPTPLPVGVPDAPTRFLCVASPAGAACKYTAPVNQGGTVILSYTVTCVSLANGTSVSATGNTLALTVTGLQTGVGYTCSATATNSLGTGAASSAVVVTGTRGASNGGSIDYSGAGKSYVVVRTQAGISYSALLNSQNQLVFSTIADPGTGWSVLGAGDFSGIGRSDLLSQEISSGTVKIWGGFQQNAETVLRVVKPGWQVQAITDIDGDGKADILWRFYSTPANPSPNPDDNGVVFVWFMNGTQVDQVANRGGAPVSWDVAGAADLHGNGRSDVIFVSPAKAIRSLTAQPNRAFVNELIGNVPSGYTLTQLGDINGDGKADLLFRNAAGNMKAWLMNGINVTSEINLPDTDPSWEFFAVGDLNGDGTLDIIFRRPDNTLVVWLMNAASPSTPTVYLNAGSVPAGAITIQP